MQMFSFSRFADEAAAKSANRWKSTLREREYIAARTDMENPIIKEYNSHGNLSFSLFFLSTSRGIVVVVVLVEAGGPLSPRAHAIYPADLVTMSVTSLLPYVYI